jgi:hypothetical protein
MAIGDHRHPMVLHLRRQLRLPIGMRGRRLPLQPLTGIRGFRGLVLLDLLIMTQILRLAQRRIEMRDRPRRLRPMVMGARRPKGKPHTETLDRHREKLPTMMGKKELPPVMRDHRPVTEPPIRGLDHLPLRLYVGFNVARGRAEGRMARQHLHVSQ